MVTGGLGYIGSHTCINLLAKGYHLIVIDSLINSSKVVVDKIMQISKIPLEKSQSYFSFIKGDLRDKDFLNNVFKNYCNKDEKIDAVIHFAGLKSVVESTMLPLKYWDFNVTSTINLLKVMENYKCFRFVFSSSATIYGAKETNISIKENDPIKPINTYGKTKEVIENILESLVNIHNNRWRIAVLRYFNPIGAHDSGLIGENPIITPTNIVPIINKVAANQIKRFPIYGNDWDTADGTCVRDYIHVMDLAESHLKALEYTKKDKSLILKLNIGTGKGTSVLQLLNTFEKVNKVKIPYEFSSRREW